MAHATGILQGTLLCFTAIFGLGILVGACVTTDPTNEARSPEASSALVLKDIDLSLPLNVQVARLPGVFLSKSGELRIRRALGPPLVVVDGRQLGIGGLATLDPADVARIEIVKGPQTASYGQRGMRGVLEVTTKHEMARRRR